MKKKLLAALLAVLALAIAAVTVFAADTPAYTVDENGNITLDVEVWLLGDTNGDGEVDIFDLVAVNDHIQTTSLLTGYSYNCADTNEDTQVDIFDLVAINDHIQTTIPLW